MCMCGDPYCWSCGPAQGNSKCPNCGKWAADGGCDDPEACATANRAADEAYYQDWLKMEADAASYRVPPALATEEQECPVG